MIKLTDAELIEYMAKIELIGMLFDLDDVSVPIGSRDKNDNYLLATLIVSQATYLITGDKDLLCLAEHYPIITPADFADKYLQF